MLIRTLVTTASPQLSLNRTQHIGLARGTSLHDGSFDLAQAKWHSWTVQQPNRKWSVVSTGRAVQCAHRAAEWVAAEQTGRQCVVTSSTLMADRSFLPEPNGEPDVKGKSSVEQRDEQTRGFIIHNVYVGLQRAFWGWGMRYIHCSDLAWIPNAKSYFHTLDHSWHFVLHRWRQCHIVFNTQNSQWVKRHHILSDHINLVQYPVFLLFAFFFNTFIHIYWSYYSCCIEGVIQVKLC